MERKRPSMDPANLPILYLGGVFTESVQKKLDKGVLFLIIHLMVIVSVPFHLGSSSWTSHSGGPFPFKRGESAALLLKHDPSRRVIVSC